MSAPGSENRVADFGRAYWRSAARASEQLAPLTPTSLDEATFQMLADNVPTLCWVANGDGYIVWYNRRWHEYCGTTPDLMEGWGWTVVHDPKLLPSVMERWTNSIATGEPFEMTFPLRGADGVFRPFLTRVQPVRDASGAVARWFGVNTEIFDQVAVEQALREERDRSRGVLDSMAEGFALLDREFRVLDINAEGMRLEARPREAIIGLTHWQAWPGTEESELGQLYKRAMADRITATLEHCYVWPDGHEAWLEVRVYPTGDGLALFYRDITTRKLADAALLESEQRLRLVVESAVGYAILTTDLDRRITSWSPGAAAIFGYSVEEAVGRSSDLIFTREDRNAHIPEQEANAAKNAGEALDVRWHQRKDGSPVFLHATMHSLRDASGQEIGFLKIARDETESHIASETVAAQAAEREAILGQLGEGVIVTDTQGRITFINEAAERLHGVKMLGVPPEEYANAYSLLTEDGAPYPAHDLPLARAVLRGETVIDACWRIRRPDGSEVLAIGSARPIKGPGGTAFGAVLTVRDDTDRKRAEDELRRSRDELEAEREALEILNATGTQVAAVLDLETLVQQVVDAGVALTGAQFGAFFYNVLDDAGGSYLLYALAGADRSQFESFGLPKATAVFAPTFRGDGVVRSDDILKDERYGQNKPHKGMPEGHLPVRSYLAVPVKSRSGEVIGGLFFGHEQPGVFGDRAERVMTGLASQAAIGIDNARLFDAVQRAKVELEERVIARTAELEQAHEALRQSQKMEAVGQLTGGIAHDFNNMLAVVIGSLDLLGRRIGTSDPRATRYVDAAVEGAQRAALLTQRLLAFSRQQPLRPESIEVNKLVAGMSELIRGSIGSDIRLETVLASGLWRAHADPNQLESALLNLAVNARDAMPDGGRLTIETANCHLDDRYAATHLGLTAGQYVMIAVTDTGTGMPEEVIAKAFDPFFTTKDVGKGTGLGLSQVYGFVKQSGGHVKIYSEPGQGTTVKVYLERLKGPEGHQAETDEAVDLPTGDSQEVVLVVEDEPGVRQFSVDALTELGYSVLEADGAAAALHLLDSHPEIELLFTDVVMPEVNGRKLADEARRRRPGLRVLFTTGYTRNAVVHNGVLDPGVQLIGKPYTVAELAAKVREVLDAQTAT